MCLSRYVTRSMTVCFDGFVLERCAVIKAPCSDALPSSSLYWLCLQKWLGLNVFLSMRSSSLWCCMDVTLSLPLGVNVGWQLVLRSTCTCRYSYSSFGNLALTEKSVSCFFPGFFLDAVLYFLGPSFVSRWCIKYPSFDFGVMCGFLLLQRNRFVVEWC